MRSIIDQKNKEEKVPFFGENSNMNGRISSTENSIAQRELGNNFKNTGGR
jgi:hypothetical protein